MKNPTKPKQTQKPKGAAVENDSQPERPETRAPGAQVSSASPPLCEGVACPQELYCIEIQTKTQMRTYMHSISNQICFWDASRHMLKRMSDSIEHCATESTQVRLLQLPFECGGKEACANAGEIRISQDWGALFLGSKETLAHTHTHKLPTCAVKTPFSTPGLASRETNQHSASVGAHGAHFAGQATAFT